MTKVSIEHKINANEERFHSIGDFFEFTDEERNHSAVVLCQVDHKIVAAIPIDSFNRYCDPVVVINPFKITEDELFKVLGENKYFRKISKVNISIEE